VPPALARQVSALNRRNSCIPDFQHELGECRISQALIIVNRKIPQTFFVTSHAGKFLWLSVFLFGNVGSGSFEDEFPEYIRESG